MTPNPPQLTFKVNYAPPPPPEEGAETKDCIFATSPMFDLATMLGQILPQHIHYATEDCIADIAALGLNKRGVVERLKRLQNRSARYRDSRWCWSNVGNYQGWVACDNYTVRIKEEIDDRRYECIYYVKFGLSPDGNFILQISFHLS